MLIQMIINLVSAAKSSYPGVEIRLKYVCLTSKGGASLAARRPFAYAPDIIAPP